MDLSNPYKVAELVSEYVLFVIIWIINYFIYKKYQERKTRVASLLFRAFTFFSISAVFQSLDTFFFDDLSLATLGYKISAGYAGAVVFASIASYFILLFAAETFRTSTTRATVVGTVNIIVACVFAIFKMLNQALSSTICLGIEVVLSFYIYGNLLHRSYVDARKLSELSDLLDRRSFEFIGNLGLFMILLYISFTVEAIVFYGTTSIFGALGWILGVIGAIYAYIGFCRPKWFVKRYETKDSSD